MGFGSELLVTPSSSMVDRISWLGERVGFGGIGGATFVGGGRFGGAFASSHADARAAAFADSIAAVAA